MKNSSVIVTVTNRTILRTILWIVATIALFKFVEKISHILTLIFAAFFLALALNPVVSKVSQISKIKSRVQATSVAYIVVISILVGFFALVTPPLIKQTRDFIKQVPQQIENFQNQDSSLARAAKHYKLDQKITESANEFASNYGDFGSTVLNTTKRVVESIASVLAVLVLAFMMLVEGPYWLALYWRTIPSRKREHRKKIAYDMYKGVTGFVNGQIIVSLIAGLVAFITLEIASHIIGVTVNAAALAGIVAAFGLIPLFGNPLSSTIVVLVCMLSSVSLALVMLGYFIIYYFVESHTFQPYIQSRLNKLTALSVLVAAIIGIGFAGFLGAIVAVPAASAIKILLEDYFSHKHIEEPSPAKVI